MPAIQIAHRVEELLARDWGTLACTGSARMAELAREVVHGAGLGPASGGPVHIVSGCMEDLDCLPGSLQQVQS